MWGKRFISKRRKKKIGDNSGDKISTFNIIPQKNHGLVLILFLYISFPQDLKNFLIVFLIL